MKIADGKAVQIDYTLRNDKGAVLDSSEGRDPLAYLHGAGNIIPGLEAALTGKEPGDTLSVTIPAAEAYGEREDDLVTTVERALFPDPKQVQLGMRLRVQTGGRHPSGDGDRDGGRQGDAGHEPPAGGGDAALRRGGEGREGGDPEEEHAHGHAARRPRPRALDAQSLAQ